MRGDLSGGQGLAILPAKQISRRIVVLVPNFPSRVQSFIAQELLSLERLGYHLEIRPQSASGNDAGNEQLFSQIQASIVCPAGNPFIRLSNTLRAWRNVRRMNGYSRAWQALAGDFKSNMNPMHLINFSRALNVAAKIDPDSDVLYAQFLKHPASIAHYASLMTGVPWACSAHARDVWLASQRDIKQKAGSASWIATCTTRGADILKRYADEPSRIHSIYHGVDASRYPRNKPVSNVRDGSDPQDPVRLLSVGRIVQKKGFHVLLDALALLPKSLNWSLRHIGPGRVSKLQKQAADLGISDRVEFVGYQASHGLIEEYRTCDVFVLPCLVDQSGDMDGLPNALAEAASQSAACVTTSISEIPKLFENTSNALVVEPEDATALAAAIETAIGQPALRDKLGKAGAETIRQRFNHAQQVEQLAKLFEQI